MTFLFYRLNKTEIATLSLESIERGVLDPAAVIRPVPVPPSPLRQIGKPSCAKPRSQEPRP